MEIMRGCVLASALLCTGLCQPCVGQAAKAGSNWAGATFYIGANTKAIFILNNDGTHTYGKLHNPPAGTTEETNWQATDAGAVTVVNIQKVSTGGASVVHTITQKLTLQGNGECSGTRKFEAKGTVSGKQIDITESGAVRYRVVFANKGSSTEMPQPNGGGGLSDAERQFDREVFAEIRRIIRENPNSWAITHQNIADQIRRGRGPNGGRKETPQMVAVEHYFFGLTLSPIASLVPADGAEIAHWWESIRAIGGNPGPRGDFQGRIEFWGGAGLNGWQVK